MDDAPQQRAKKKEYYAKGKNSPLEQGTEIPLNWKPSVEKPLPPTRCNKTVKNGERKGQRCGKWAAPGTAGTCEKHGGQLPSVQNAAKNRVEEARRKLLGIGPDAVAVIEEIMQRGDNDGVRLKAAQDVLDRTGVLKGQEINMEVKQVDDSARIIRERLAEMRASMLDGNDVVSVEETTEEEADIEIEED